MKPRQLFATTLAAIAAFTYSAAAAAPRLKVSDNQRFLVDEDGRPFFYLGDTAWELFHRLNREEAERYLADRANSAHRIRATTSTGFSCSMTLQDIFHGPGHEITE